MPSHGFISYVSTFFRKETEEYKRMLSIFSERALPKHPFTLLFPEIII
jgi:hypothetical protein